MEDRFSLTKWINPGLMATVILLLVYGCIVVRSAVSGYEGGDGLFKRQLFGIAVGIVPLVIAWFFDYRKIKDWTTGLFMLDALLILSPRIPGLSYAAKGASSWLAIGGVRLFQPSEPAKLITILLLASIVARYQGKIESLADLAKVVGLSLVPLVLILTQPDLGTGLVFVAIMFGMLLVGGARVRAMVIMIVAGALLVGGVLWLNGYLFERTGEYKIIKEYQLNRLLVFVDQERDPKGAGYNLKQSKIAIGSGEITGKGLGSGTQGNLNFLPERHTDFIFSVLGEELGFAGGLLLLGLYLALLMVALNIAVSSIDLYGTLIAVGIITMWTFQILENIGMTIGLMPITGIPLPFMSYGSSFMVTNLACVGVLLSIWSRRPYVSSTKGV